MQAHEKGFSFLEYVQNAKLYERKFVAGCLRKLPLKTRVKCIDKSQGRETPCEKKCSTSLIYFHFFWLAWGLPVCACHLRWNISCKAPPLSYFYIFFSFSLENKLHAWPTDIVFHRCEPTTSDAVENIPLKFSLIKNIHNDTKRVFITHYIVWEPWKIQEKDSNWKRMTKEFTKSHLSIQYYSHKTYSIKIMITEK